MKRWLPLLAAIPLLVLGVGVGGPATSASMPVCAVVGADLGWGFKESFRAYIDSSIANGEWTVSDGAGYDTPEFGWRHGAGWVDPSRSSGVVSFAGAVRFTGHGGFLEITVANPVLRFVDASSAILLLDVTGVTMEGDPIESESQEFVLIDLSDTDLSPANGTITVTRAPTVLTDDGAVAFPNYESGTPFDPISFVLPVGDCVLMPPPVGPGPTVVFSLIVGAAVIAVVALAVVLSRRRR